MAERTMAVETRPEDDTISLTSSRSEEFDPEEEFTVDRILAEKTQDGKRMYLISWESYPLEKSTWEPRAHINSELLDQWKERKLQEANGEAEPFDFLGFDALLLQLAKEKAERRRRRQAKRRALSRTESEIDQADDSDSSIEALVEHSIEDDTGLNSKTTKRKSKSPSKKLPKSSKRSSIGGDDSDRAPKRQENKRTQNDLNRSSPDKPLSNLRRQSSSSVSVL